MSKEQTQKNRRKKSDTMGIMDFGWRCLLFTLPHQIEAIWEFVLLLLHFSRGWPTEFDDTRAERI